jgi:DNA-binding MarR family transcriptional regulator
MPRLVVGHTCGHPFSHRIPDEWSQSREYLDIADWHDWMHSQPCLECSRPAGLPPVAADPVADRLIQAALASVKLKGSRERTDLAEKISHSRFTTTPNSVFDNAKVTLRQAQLLEFLFLHPNGRATLTDLARQFGTSNVTIGLSVNALLKRGLVRRVSDSDDRFVTPDRAAWRLRLSFHAWDRWLTAEGRQP